MVTRGFQRPQEFKQCKINGFPVIAAIKPNVTDVAHVIRSHISRSDDVRSVEKFNSSDYIGSKGKSA